MLMFISAFGFPDTFYGDASVGSLATSKSLDRPTELKILDRQTMWAEALRRICDFVLDRSAAAPNGVLAGKALVKNKAAADVGVVPLSSDPKAGEEIDRFVEVLFPNILEHDIKEQIAAIVLAATLGNTQGQLAGTIDLQTLSMMVLRELGAEQIDEILDMMFPAGMKSPTGIENQATDEPDPNPEVPGPDQPDPNDRPQPSLDDDLARSATATESRLRVAAVKELREALIAFHKKYARPAA